MEEAPRRGGHHTKKTPISLEVGRKRREGAGIRHIRMDTAVVT